MVISEAEVYGLESGGQGYKLHLIRTVSGAPWEVGELINLPGNQKEFQLGDRVKITITKIP